MVLTKGTACLGRDRRRHLPHTARRRSRLRRVRAGRPSPGVRARRASARPPARRRHGRPRAPGPGRGRLRPVPPPPPPHAAALAARVRGHRGRAGARRVTVALVLAGGGARGAYEAGALSVLLPALEARGERPVIVVGTSVGALNATFVAATAHLPAAD